VLLSFSAD